MKKPFILLLLLTSLFGYLEWGGGNSQFLFQMEAEVLKKLWTNPKEALHPFTVLPLIGQILLLVALFQKKPRPGMVFTAAMCIGLLLAFVLAIGLMSKNWKVIACSVPFFAVAILAVVDFRRNRRTTA
jgi:hypothetical protein